MTSTLLYSLAALLSLVVLSPATWSYFRATRNAHDQAERLSRIQSDARALTETQSSLPDWALRAPQSTAHSPSTSDALAPRVSAALAAVGLPASVLSSLSVQPNTDGGVVAGAIRIHRRRATLILSQPTLPQLGTFLQAWRTREPNWTVTSIDIGLERTDKPPAPGADLPLHTVLTLESLSLQPTSPAGATR